MTNPHYSRYFDEMVAKNEPLLTALVYKGAAELNLTAHPFATEAPFYQITYTVLWEKPNAFCILHTTTDYVELASCWSYYGGNPLPEEFIDVGWLKERWKDERKKIAEAAKAQGFRVAQENLERIRRMNNEADGGRS